MLARPGLTTPAELGPRRRVPRGLRVSTHPDCVMHRDVLDIEHGQGDARVHHFVHAVENVGWGDAAEDGISSRRRNRLAHRVEHGNAAPAWSRPYRA